MTKKKIPFGQIISYLIILIMLVMVLYPIFLMLVKSFKDASQELHDPLSITFPLYFNNYQFAWAYVKDLIVNTIIISLAITLGSVLICSVTAYGFVRFEFPLKNFLFMMILALMMVPGVLTLIPSYSLINTFGLVDNRLGVIIPGIVGSIPFGTFLLKTFFSGLPKDLFGRRNWTARRSFCSTFTLRFLCRCPFCSRTESINSWGLGMI